MIWNVLYNGILQDGIKELLFRAVDLITTVVPPGLPAAMTVGTIYAVRRLKQHKICCTSPPRYDACHVHWTKCSYLMSLFLE